MERNSQTVKEFCTSESISKSMFYKLRKLGLAPKIMKVGRLTRISTNAINDWRRKMEAASAK